jgi:hypothetical protein
LFHITFLFISSRKGEIPAADFSSIVERTPRRFTLYSKASSPSVVSERLMAGQVHPAMALFF